MIIAIGIDSIEIDRFKDFKMYTTRTLLKIFSPGEILYSRASKVKSAERFAARFAAKEATYKAICSALEKFSLRPIRVLRYISLQHQKNGHVLLNIEWKKILCESNFSNVSMLTAHVSITHTRTVATAVVVFEK